MVAPPLAFCLFLLCRRFLRLLLAVAVAMAEEGAGAPWGTVAGLEEEGLGEVDGTLEHGTVVEVEPPARAGGGSFAEPER